MRLTDEERILLGNLHNHLLQQVKHIPEVHLELLARLATKPEPPPDTVPVKVWCAAWEAGKVCSYAGMTSEAAITAYLAGTGVPWVAPDHATIHMRVQKRPQGIDLGDVYAEEGE